MPSVRLFIVPWPSAWPNARSTRSATRELVSTLPATTAAGGRASSSVPGSVITFTGRCAPALAGMSGSVSTRTANRQALRVTASGQLRLPRSCAALPVKSSVSSSPAIVARRRSSRSPSRASSTSRRRERAVGQRGEARAGAALGVVEHLGGRGPQRRGPDARRELAQARDAGAVGGELRAQVGTALGAAGASARRARRRPPRRARAGR